MKIIITLCLTVFTSLALIAQDYNFQREDIVKLALKDGSIIIGNYKMASDSSIIVHSTLLGQLIIPKHSISHTTLLHPFELEIDSLGYPIDFHNSTHYIVSPTAYGLKKGQSYYENIAIFWNSYAVGLTENFSIAIGGEIISVLFTQNFPIVFFSPKLSFPFKNNKGAFALTATIFTTPESDFKTFAFVSADLTLGSRNNNFTLGGGIGWNTEGGFKDEVVPLTLSGMKRISQKISLISENWFIVENDFDDITSIVSAGLRIHFNKPGSAFNVGLWRLLGTDLADVIAFPYVSAVIALK
jgi:hypothetical protein